mmetsp:Transcript_27837/g.28084  ORF Transcript_27837/g.28084 Transcript_27837/m.28084 type:complete len:152 (+) Transcript_27837:164-619(+)|eukprot:CAMPEP_0182424790 /NCGR_PEP_ID=MMETSP1167-20130531/11056_1 /TAXON_ID=2988 /ORGANISM="Mallomonas Sp, Strain CCMP3275" /LENGTH=151 /DNA_ID=CAMNT_0024604875 /DNA_START=157 /DNA_END=612 /DNA_ORIENTATION=-
MNAVTKITGDPYDAIKREKPTPPDLDGELSKLKHKQSLFGSWTKRYFRVNPDTECIEYFKSKSASLLVPAEPLGLIELSELSNVRKFDGCSFQIEAGPNVYFLMASSMAEQMCWIRELENYLLERQEYDRWLASFKALERDGDLDKLNTRK